MKIKVLEKTLGCMPCILEKGDWIDLCAAEDTHLESPIVTTAHKRKGEDRHYERNIMFDSTLIPLGVIIKVPKGYESIVVPRSSTFKRYGIIQTNSMGVIDNKYCGKKDEWRFPVMATRETIIPKGTRIAQFRVQLSQKATIWQKIKWLFTSKVKIESVNFLDDPSRGGFGSTGE